MTATAIAARNSIHVGQPESIGLANVVRSEWTKLRTVRSTYWTAIAAVIATVGVAVLGASEYVPIHMAQVVAWGVRAVLGEFLAESEVGGAV